MQQPEETQRKLFFIAKPHTTGEKSQTYEFQPSSPDPWFGQTVDHTQQSPEAYNTQQTSRLLATDSKCRQKPTSMVGLTLCF